MNAFLGMKGRDGDGRRGGGGGTGLTNILNFEFELKFAQTNNSWRTFKIYIINDIFFKKWFFSFALQISL